MKQNVHEGKLRYQDFLILAYFKANYKKYEFNQNLLMMGMTYFELRKSIECLIELKYLVCIKNFIVISKLGEHVLEEKRLSHFFCDKKENGEKYKKQLKIDEPYIPNKFEM